MAVKKETPTLNESFIRESTRSSPENGNPQEFSSAPEELAYAAIAERAYELWLINGCRTGFHEADWKQAEEELRARGAQPQEEAKAASASN